jgi:lysophospholipase L1-like esterase
MSVAVFGSSVTALVTGPRNPDSLHLTWPAALARTERAGVSFQVTNRSRIYGLVTDFAGIWADPLAQLRPDVVVLQFGLGETFPRVVPRALVLHLLGIDRHTGPLRDRYWRKAHEALLDIHALERRLDPHLPGAWSRVTPTRFERELKQLCNKIHDQIGSRIVVMTAYPGTSVAPFVTPSMVARLHTYNEAIVRVAGQTGSDVFPLHDIIERLGPATTLTDGLHMTVEAHRAVADRMAQTLSPAALHRAIA